MAARSSRVTSFLEYVAELFDCMDILVLIFRFERKGPFISSTYVLRLTCFYVRSSAAAPPSAGFKCPWKKKEDQEQEAAGRGGGGVGGKGGSVNKIVKRLGGGAGAAAADGAEEEELKDPRYKNIDPKMIEMIENEIVDNSPGITWDDIAGLEFAKSSVQEIVVWPMLRPDLFTGTQAQVLLVPIQEQALVCPPIGFRTHITQLADLNA